MIENHLLNDVKTDSIISIINGINENIWYVYHTFMLT